MYNFAYKNVTVTGAASLEEAKRQAITAWLEQAGQEPTEQQIAAALAEYEALEAAALATRLAKAEFGGLPDWATWTGAEAAEALREGILNGMTKAEARAAIDAQFAGVTNLAQLGAATVAILKQLADAVIDGRDLGHQSEARAIMYLRDIVGLD